MTEDTLLELVRGQLYACERAIDSLKASPPSETKRGAGLADLIQLSLGICDSTQRIWDSAYEAMAARPIQDLQTVGEVLRNTFASTLIALRAIRADIRTVEQVGRTVKQTEDFDRALENL